MKITCSVVFNFSNSTRYGSLEIPESGVLDQKFHSSNTSIIFSFSIYGIMIFYSIKYIGHYLIKVTDLIDTFSFRDQTRTRGR